MKVVKLLLIEDSPFQSELLKDLLLADDQEYELSIRPTVEAGLIRLSESEVDLILLDLNLPDSQGEETFTTVHAAAASVPIIVTTGLEDEALALRLVKRGAQDYLLKSQIDRPILARSIRYAIERKQVHETLRQTKDEFEARVAQRTEALRDSNLALEREVGERRRAESALRESNRQLGQALHRLRDTQEAVVQRERLHALGLMARGVVHSFNNTLSPVIGFSELLMEKPEILEDREKALEYLGMIHTSAKQIASMVEQLDEFHRERDSHEKVELVDIARVLDDAVQMTAYRWRNQALAAGIKIAVETSYDERPQVEGSRSELLEVFSNLLLNAADALEKDGTITVELRDDVGHAMIAVRDEGRGMSEEVRLRCVEPFFSTKGMGGSGLGLGIVYGIVSRHGGTIEIDSAEGEGTSLLVALPKFQPDKTENLPEVSEVPAEPVSARILVVDDETLVREVLQAYLENDGHQVITAENGELGLEAFRADKFDLVLTDRAMPEMNGDQLALAIKAVSPTTPVILLTGFGDETADGGPKLPGIDFVLGKPFSMDSLRTTLAKALQLT